MKTENLKIKDSGARTNFATGSMRDDGGRKGRPSLISQIPMRVLAIHMQDGAAKYSDRNWEKGQPLSRYIDAAERHMWSVENDEKDENHMGAWLWNVHCFIHTAYKIAAGELPEELNDLGLDLTNLPVSLEDAHAWRGGKPEKKEPGILEKMGIPPMTGISITAKPFTGQIINDDTYRGKPSADEVMNPLAYSNAREQIYTSQYSEDESIDPESEGLGFNFTGVY